LASEPNNLKVLTALKIDKIELCIEENPYVIKDILNNFKDEDNDISKGAKAAAINLHNQVSIDHLFYLCVKEGNERPNRSKLRGI
jgi:hypothetical protein